MTRVCWVPWGRHCCLLSTPNSEVACSCRVLLLGVPGQPVLSSKTRPTQDPGHTWRQDLARLAWPDYHTQAAYRAVTMSGHCSWPRYGSQGPSTASACRLVPLGAGGTGHSPTHGAPSLGVRGDLLGRPSFSLCMPAGAGEDGVRGGRWPRQVPTALPTYLSRTPWSFLAGWPPSPLGLC